jgi:tetratricopeptide (TPR) repeat protein
MAEIVKLKKKASDLEAIKQGEKALAVYVEIVEAYEARIGGTIDIPLYNRVGDMLQKAGQVGAAVEIWEKAVDRYTEGGFHNPAIALCNKILRYSPGRTVIYYKLGQIHAEKGLKVDARQNFLEYASRQQKSGNLDDAFRALQELADLVPDQHDVRVMLADQLAAAGRNREAIAQLQLGYSQATTDGSSQAAAVIVAKMKEIDPSVEPEATEAATSTGGGGLVFLDTGDDAPPPLPPRRSTTAPPPEPPKPAAPAALKKDADDAYVSLGDWLRDDDEPHNTPMVGHENEPAGIAESVDDHDPEAHYDLGVAYKEMGLVDEAILEFQKALRGTKSRARTFEALGDCFIQQQQFTLAASILRRALSEAGVGEESLVGVLYLLGTIAEQQQFGDAKQYYERVCAVDLHFRDIGDRLNTVEQQLS